MAISVTTVLQTVRRASIAAAVAEPAEDRARAAQTSRTTPRTRARAQSIRTTADGDATPPFFTVVGSATAAPTKVVAQTSTVRDHAVIQVGTGTSVTAASPAVRRVNIGVSAAAPGLGHAYRAPISLRMRPIRARALST